MNCIEGDNNVNFYYYICATRNMEIYIRIHTYTFWLLLFMGLAGHNNGDI